jgi:hypothetical protein
MYKALVGMQAPTWGSYIQGSLPLTSEREYLQAKLPDGLAESGPAPVILLALEGKEDILPLQSELFTNFSYYASCRHKKPGA